MFKKETKTESKKENIKKDSKKSITTSVSDGNIVRSSTSMFRQISSTSHSSEITAFEAVSTQSLPSQSISNSTTFPIQGLTKIMSDATPFQFRPPGTAFTRGLSARPVVPPQTANPIDPEFTKKLTIKVKKSQCFRDSPGQTKVPIYKTRSRNRGLLLLVNNIQFIDQSERVGAVFDEKNLVDLFEGIGFEIKKYRNLTKQILEKKIIKFRTKPSLNIYDIATVIIMSHGTGTDNSNSTQVVCSDNELLQTSWIINQFDNSLCPQLIGKPKIFIFQCCRGNRMNVVQHDSVPFQPRQQSDMLIAYSTIPGFLSNRDPKTGTWYIQAICKVFMEHAHEEDVESLLKIVDHKLSYLVAEGSARQTSSFENRGFKTCYLHPQIHE